MLVVIASAVYMLWMFQRVFFTVPSDWMRRWWPTLRDMNRNEWIALAPLVILVVALGVYPGPVLELFAAPVDRIIEAVERRRPDRPGSAVVRPPVRSAMVNDLVTLLPELILTVAGARHHHRRPVPAAGAASGS